MACDQPLSPDEQPGAVDRFFTAVTTTLRGYYRGGAPVMRNMWLSLAFLVREGWAMATDKLTTYKAKRDFEKTHRAALVDLLPKGSPHLPSSRRS